MFLKDILAMSAPMRLATIATITGLFFAQPSIQQTWTNCNPLHQTCQPDPALGRSIYADFTQGASNDFTTDGNPTFSSQGGAFTVSGPGDAPQVQSNGYIMFGKYDITMKAAPGAGIVSSIVLQSADLDEIDWELLGASNDQVQTNYFGKGITTTYDRMVEVNVDNTQGEWHTYSLEWTSEQITWAVDGTVLRTLTPADADPGQYPQTPMQLRIGSWAGGDPSNPPGTITWAEGPTNYADGPFTMYVSKVSMVDYSTGTSYKYGDQSGDWTSIIAIGGKVNGNVGGALAESAAPTPVASGSVQPFIQPSASATISQTSYPGLPSGWSVNPTTGKVVPPSSAAPVSKLPPVRTDFSGTDVLTTSQSISQSASPTSQPAVSPAAGSSACEYNTVTGYNEKGFLTTATVPVGAKTQYDDRGFPVTVYPKGCGDSTLALQNKGVAEPTPGDGVIGAKAGFATSTTAQTLPTDNSVYLESKAKSRTKGTSTDESGASTLAARCVAAFGIFMSASLFLA